MFDMEGYGRYNVFELFTFISSFFGQKENEGDN